MMSRVVISLLSCVVALVTCRSVSQSGLQVEVTRPVNCRPDQKAQNGDKVTVHYGGFLQDGKYQPTAWLGTAKIGFLLTSF